MERFPRRRHYRRNMQLLVVEDEPKMAELLRRGLTEEGHSVTVASTGGEALDLALNHSFDAASREVLRSGRSIGLTRTEFSILSLLMRNTGRVVTRESLIEQVWGHDADIESNTLDAFVRLLRAKVELAGEPKLIHTVRGVGYCLKAGDPL